MAQDLRRPWALTGTPAARQAVLPVEAPHQLNLIGQVPLDTIYHEHYSFCSLLAVERLLSRHGLHVFDADHLTTHGGRQ